MKKQVVKSESKDASYYKLHTGAVEDLVTATKENTPRYSEEELNRYLLYGFLLIFLVITAYNVINGGIVMLFGSENAPLLHVEPLFFGIITTAADWLCVYIRNSFLKIVADAKQK